MESGFTSMAAAAATTFTVLVFLRAGWHKLSDFGTFTGYVADYRLLPEALVEPAARGLPARPAPQAAAGSRQHSR